MANINDIFTSNYLKASDLNGSAVLVTIATADIEEIGKSRDKKIVVHFVGKQKAFVCNKTNSKKIAEIVGSPDTDDWGGHAVLLYPTEVDFQGDTVEAIRVKAPKTVQAPKAKPTVDVADDDSIPF